MLDLAIQQGRTEIHTVIAKKINPNPDKKNAIINKFKRVKTMGAGLSFGELSLLTNERRAATVRCITDCKFAGLRKTDYLWSIGQEMKIRL